MPHDTDLADRLRDRFAGDPEVTEKRMFGGVAFLLGGHLAISASSRGGLLVRCDPGQTEALLDPPRVDRFEMRGRPMAGWLHVAAHAVTDDAALGRWVEIGTAYAGSLPPA